MLDIFNLQVFHLREWPSVVFSPSAKRLESYQEAASEDEDSADTPSGSLSNMVKPRAPSCRTVHNRPLGSISSNHLTGSCFALESREGASEVPHSRQAAFSSPIVSVIVWLATCLWWIMKEHSHNYNRATHCCLFSLRRDCVSSVWLPHIHNILILEISVKR